MVKMLYVEVKSRKINIFSCEQKKKKNMNIIQKYFPKKHKALVVILLKEKY